MINSNKVLFFLLIFIGFSLPAFAQNDSAKIKKMTKGADVIITGRVTQKKSSWNENKTKIYTRATLQVDEYLKGQENGNSVEVIYPGGEVGEVGELYTHMPRFEENEEVLVFLKKDKNQKGFKVYDGEEGKITVVKDVKSNEKITRSKMHINDLKTEIKKYIVEQ